MDQAVQNAFCVGWVLSNLAQECQVAMRVLSVTLGLTRLLLVVLSVSSADRESIRLVLGWGMRAPANHALLESFTLVLVCPG